MFGLFKQKSDPKKIINNFQAKAFKAWGVEPNDIATELRFKTALGVYISILMTVTIDNHAVVEKLSQKIFRHITDTVKNKRCRVSDIFSIEHKVKCADFSQSIFLEEAEIDKPSIIMNGFGILDCLAQVIGNDCAMFLQGRDGGDLVNAGMLMLRDLSVGGIDGVDMIAGMQLTNEFMIFYEEMVKISKDNSPSEKANDQQELLRHTSFEKNTRERASLKAELIQLQIKRETNLYGLLLLLLLSIYVAAYLNTSLIVLCFSATLLLGIIFSHYNGDRYKRIKEIESELRNKSKLSFSTNYFLLLFAVIGLVWYLY